MPEPCVLFDLDGTLTDPYEGISKSVQHALAHFGIAETDEARLRSFIGPPLRESFANGYNMSPEDCEKAVEVFRERFGTVGKFENKLYDGIPEMLKTLVSKGFILAVASSKAQIYVEQIVEHFGLSEYFTFIGGSELDGVRSHKHEVIEYVLEALGITDKTAVLMVGDRKHDLQGAEISGIGAVGVLWGYGDRAELSAYKNLGLSESTKELCDICLRWKNGAGE